MINILEVAVVWRVFSFFPFCSFLDQTIFWLILLFNFQLNKLLMDASASIPEGNHRLQSTYCLWYSKKASGKSHQNSFDQVCTWFKLPLFYLQNSQWATFNSIFVGPFWRYKRKCLIIFFLSILLLMIISWAKPIKD